MKKVFTLLVCMLTFVGLIGCNPTGEDQSGQNQATNDHGHSHDDGDDDHDDGHSHGDAPHGGTLFDWGGGAYHVEFTVDHDQQEVTVYILGGDAKTPAPIKADKLQLVIDEPATELELTASPLDGQVDGMTSRFVGKHETIGIVREFSGTVSGVVDGTPYTGDFKEEPHGHDH